MTATAKGNVDEGKVQEIAARQGTTVARFLVEKEHFKAKIYADRAESRATHQGG